jgi:hypothetical protein
MTRALPAALCTTLLALALDPAGAAAQEVVVSEFTGPGSPMAKRMARSGLAEARAIDVIDEGDADGDEVLIRGTIARQGRQWIAVIRVADAAGNDVGEETFRGRTSGALGQALRRTIYRRTRELIEQAASGETAPPEQEEPAYSGPTRRVGLADFDGSGGAVAAAAARDALRAEEGIEVVTVGGLPEDPEDLIELAREEEVAAFVGGEVNREGRVWVATVQLRNGADGEVVAEEEFRARGSAALSAAIERGLVRSIGPALARTWVPGPEDEEDEDEEDEDEEDEDEEDYGDDGGEVSTPSALEAGVAFHLFTRRYRYEDDIFTQLRGYRLRVGPMVSIGADWYPAAHFTDSFAANFGLQVRFAFAFGLTSVDASGARFPTKSIGYLGGARMRLPIGQHEIGFAVGFGGQTFSLQAADGDDPNIPDVNYKFVRIGADVRIGIGDLGLYGGGGWRQLLDEGQLGSMSWFPRLSGGAIDVSVGVGYRFSEHIELRGTFEVARYFFSMNPQPEDPWIAGGALDRYRGGSVQLLYRIPGQD